MVNKDSYEFDPFIAEKINNLQTSNTQKVINFINRKHNAIKRKRKIERQNRKKSRK